MVWQTVGNYSGASWHSFVSGSSRCLIVHWIGNWRHTANSINNCTWFDTSFGTELKPKLRYPTPVRATLRFYQVKLTNGFMLKKYCFAAKCGYFGTEGEFGTPPVLLEPSLLLTGVVTGRFQQLNALRNNHISCLSGRQQLLMYNSYSTYGHPYPRIESNDDLM